MATETLQLDSSTNQKSMMKTIDIPATKTVPVVNHTFTDEELGLLKGSKLQPLNLNKVVKLLKDPHSAMLYDRHLHILRKIIRHYCNGFLMKDLVQVFKILNLCADRVDTQPFYIEPMVELIALCDRPFLNEQASDELTFEQIAIESISQLAYLMRVPSKEVREQICKTLQNFYTQEETRKQEVQGHKANRLEFNKKVIEESDVAETLIKSLTLLENDLETRITVLKVLQKLSKASAKTCNKMLNANAAYNLTSRLMDFNDHEGQILFRSTEIVWNLLENGNTSSVTNQLNNFECVGQLRDAFLTQLSQGYSHYDRQLRNDLLIVCCLIAQYCPNSPFIETGFCKQLTLLGTFQEVKSHNALVKHLKLGTNHEDFELKKIILNLLVLLSRDSSVLPIYTESRLLLSLFHYVRPSEKETLPREWTPAQLEEIQLHAMSCLVTLSPLLPDDFMLCQGSTRLLLLLEWCTGPEDYQGAGNSLHGVGGRGSKKSQMRYCLRIMRAMTATNNDKILQDFVDQGAIGQILCVLEKFWISNLIKEEIDVCTQTDMLSILSVLCEGDTNRQNIVGQEGVKSLVPYLTLDLGALQSGLGHHQLLVSAIDCIWAAVVGYQITEDAFLELEGAYHLLDLLENAPSGFRNMILGCLLDLADNPKTSAHINSWRGNRDDTAAHLFCELWRQEEAQMGVCRDDKAGVSDFQKPLMGSVQGERGTIPAPAFYPSPAIVDISENVRAKIYALFCKMGFGELAGLTTEDHITLTIIEHYLDFKLGEVWTEIVQELKEEDLRPVTPDREAIEAISRICDDRVQHVRNVQTQLVEAEKQQDVMDEQEYFNEIRDNQRQKEKALKDFEEYIMRTSNYSYLQEAKRKQESSIDASRAQTKPKAGETQHSTSIKDIGCTTFGGKGIQVHSTPQAITGGPLSRYDPIAGTLYPRKPSFSPVSETS